MTKYYLQGDRAMNKNIYKFNRDNLLDKIKDNSIVILFAGKAIQKTGDQRKLPMKHIHLHQIEIFII